LFQLQPLYYKWTFPLGKFRKRSLVTAILRQRLSDFGELYFGSADR